MPISKKNTVSVSRELAAPAPSGRGAAVTPPYPDRTPGKLPKPPFLVGSSGSPSSSADVNASQLLQQTMNQDDIDYWNHRQAANPLSSNIMTQQEFQEALSYFNRFQGSAGMLLEAEILYEGTAKQFVINLIQFAVEAGLDLAGAGMGEDTIVDAIMATAETAGLADAIASLQDTTKITLKGVDLVKKLQGVSLRNGAGPIYDQVKSITQAAATTLKKTGADPDQALDTASDQMRDAVSEGAQAVGDFVAIFVPDIPGVDAIIAKMIETAADSSYQTFAKTFDSKFPDEAKNLLSDPNALKRGLEKVTRTLIDGLKKGQNLADKMPAFLAKMGKAGIQKTIDFLENVVVPKIPDAVRIVQTAIPFVFAAAAFMQVVYSEDYKQENEKEDNTQTQQPDQNGQQQGQQKVAVQQQSTTGPAQAAAAESRVRSAADKVLRESEHVLSNSVDPEPDLEEISGAGAVAGMTLPLGASPDGKVGSMMKKRRP